MPSRRKIILFSESGVVSSFDKIIECAEYKLNLEMLMFSKPYLEAKYKNIIDYFRTYDLTNINVTLRDKSLIESFLMDLYNAGYDIKKLFKCVPQYDYWGESDCFCGGVNYRDLYKEALERKEKFDSKMTSI